MKLTRLAVATFLVGSGVTVASAQTVVIAPEQETVIREYITTQPPLTLDPGIDLDLTVGSIVPETVEIRPVEAPTLETQYDYVVVENRTVLVEPETRRIVHIIE